MPCAYGTQPQTTSQKQNTVRKPHLYTKCDLDDITHLVHYLWSHQCAETPLASFDVAVQGYEREALVYLSLHGATSNMTHPGNLL